MNRRSAHTVLGSAGLSAHDGVKQAECYINEGYEYVVEMDLESSWYRKPW